jgi:O-antigen biosynthesis protein WbqP
MTKMIKRIIDLVLIIFALSALILPIGIVALLVRLTSKGPALYWSDRIGRNNTIFKMPKFRSMRVGTPAVATHLLANPESVLTPITAVMEYFGGRYELCRASPCFV